MKIAYILKTGIYEIVNDDQFNRNVFLELDNKVFLCCSFAIKAE